MLSLIKAAADGSNPDNEMPCFKATTWSPEKKIRKLLLNEELLFGEKQ